jgi:CAAX prenyl protease-like protein
MTSPAFPRILPFALYFVFVALEEGLRFLDGKGMIGLSPHLFLYLYPVKISCVALALFVLRRNYREIALRELARGRQTVTSIFAGLIVFIVWINMDWSFGTLTKPPGFNPGLAGNDVTAAILSGMRLFGAVAVVPLMEELFWRSFLVRYILDQNFTDVPLGRFTALSFVVSTVLFGLEHHFIFAGMMAGAVYNLLLYRSRSLAQCILAHAVTNLALGIYVLYSERWYFW